jgi:hypothetical protein
MQAIFIKPEANTGVRVFYFWFLAILIMAYLRIEHNSLFIRPLLYLQVVSGAPCGFIYSVRYRGFIHPSIEVLVNWLQWLQLS